MPFVGLAPEKARDLSTVMKAGAATADGLSSEVTAALTLSVLESDVPGHLVATGDELDQVAVVISARADIADGFVVDPIRLAADLGITVTQAEAAIAAFDDVEGGKTAEITPFLDVLVANQRASAILRSTFVNLPEPGTDVELDQAMTRMGAWLLEALESGELPANLDAAQVADLALLNQYLNPTAGVEAGAPVAVGLLGGAFAAIGADLAHLDGLGADGLKAVAQGLFDKVESTYELDSRLNKAAGLPQIEDLLHHFQRERDTFFDIPPEWSSLNDWLPAFLAGEGPASTDPEQLAMAMAVARATGWNNGTGDTVKAGAFGLAKIASSLAEAVSGGLQPADPADIDAALAHLQNGRFLQRSLIPGEFEDIDSPLIPITENGLGSAILAGQRNGVLTAESRQQVEAYAQQILAAGGGTVAGDLTEEQQQALIAAVIGQNGQEFVSDDPHIQRQLVAAINLINRQETRAAQQKLFADTIEAFRSLAVVGAPAMTHRQLDAAIGAEAAEELSYKDLSARSSERVGKRPFYLTLLANWGIEGSDKIKTKKRKFKFRFDANGELISIRKKKISKWKRFKNSLKAFGKAWLQSWKDNPWKALFDTAKIAASVVATVFPATSAAGIAAITVLAADTAVSVAEGDVLGALSSAFGAVGGVAANFATAATAGSTASMVVKGANIGKNVVDGIEATDNLIDAVDDGNILGIVGSSFGLLGNVANVVSSGAELTGELGVLGDAAGETAKTIANTGAEIAETAGQLQNITAGVGTTIAGIEDDNFAQALLGGVSVVGESVKAVTNDAGIIDDGIGLTEDFEGNLSEIGHSLADIGQTGLTGLAANQAYKNDDLIGLVTSGYHFADQAINIVTNPDGAINGLVTGEPEPEQPGVVQLPPDTEVVGETSDGRPIVRLPDGREVALTPAGGPGTRSIEGAPGEQSNGSGEITVTELGPLVEVGDGQSLSQIAQDNGVTVDRLLELNPNITDPNQIQAGQSITLPPEAQPTFYPSPARPGELGQTPELTPEAEQAILRLAEVEEQAARNGDGDAATAAAVALMAGALTGTPALKGSPYHPDEVERRVRPKYQAVHEMPGYVANPRKSPEPPDARRIFEDRRVTRVDTTTWIGRSEDGTKLYRYSSSQTGPNGERRVHWSGEVQPNNKKVPKELRTGSGSNLGAMGRIARVLGPIGYLGMYLDFKDMIDQSKNRPPDA